MNRSSNKQRGWIGSLCSVYNVKDVNGKGRFCMLISSIVTNLVTQIAGGLFFTSFLLQYGLDKSRIGIFVFIPYMACMFSIFSPLILERFKKRKAILVGGKFAYYFLNIMGITLLPTIVKEPGARIFWFVVITFVANMINHLTAPGFSAWNANFLEEKVRADFFASSGCINNAITYAITLGISYVGDMFTGTEHELFVLTLIRYIGFAIAIVDCIIWLIPKEYPYAVTERIKISNVIMLPIKNQRFLGTILVMGAHYIVYYLSQGVLNAYILEDLGISYTLVNGTNALYFVFYILFSGIVIKIVNKFYWFKTFSFAAMWGAFTFFVYSFVTADKIWLYVVVRALEHILGVFISIILSSLPYVNLPEADRTNYLSFSTLVTNFSIFLSTMLGTVFVGMMGERVLTICNYSFSSTQVLLLASGAGSIGVAVLVHSLAKKLTPPDRKMA